MLNYKLLFMEAESLRQQRERIKFSVCRHAPCDAVRQVFREAEEELGKLSDALVMLEQDGAAPVLPDGKVGGNGAMLLSVGDSEHENGGDFVLVVSKSGKKPGERLGVDEFCVVDNFDSDSWSAHYSSSRDDYKPSSDTPLLWESLMEGQRKYSWRKSPRVALHGHALADEETAARLNIPISSEETLFSTPEDVTALEGLFRENPYPEQKLFLRKNHGFFLLADSVTQAIEVYQRCILPHLNSQTINQ